MVRRRLTLRRIDPWSVLKFGFVANLALLGVFLLGAAVVWFFVQRLGLIEAVCSAATEVGFRECGINGGNLFRALLLLGLLGVVVQTGLYVFLSFLHNLIADLVGGLSFGFVDETPGSAARGEVPARGRVTANGPTGPGGQAPARSQPRPGAQAGSSDRPGPPPPLGSTGRRPADMAATRDVRQVDDPDRDAQPATQDTGRQGIEEAFRGAGRDQPEEEPMFGDRGSRGRSPS